MIRCGRLDTMANEDSIIGTQIASFYPHLAVSLADCLLRPPSLFSHKATHLASVQEMA